MIFDVNGRFAMSLIKIMFKVVTSGMFLRFNARLS